MNELMYVFAPSALIAAGMGGWGLKGWWSARSTKAALLKKLAEDVKALEDLERQSDAAIIAANEANLRALQSRITALS